MGFDSFFDTIGNGLTDAVDKVGDIGNSLGGDLSNVFSGVGGVSGILSGLGLGGLLGGSSGSSNWKTYLEYALIGIGIILVAVIIKKLIA